MSEHRIAELEAENERLRLESREWTQWREDNAAEWEIVRSQLADAQAAARAFAEVLNRYATWIYEDELEDSARAVLAAHPGWLPEGQSE